MQHVMMRKNDLEAMGDEARDARALCDRLLYVLTQFSARAPQDLNNAAGDPLYGSLAKVMKDRTVGHHEHYIKTDMIPYMLEFVTLELIGLKKDSAAIDARVRTLEAASTRRAAPAIPPGGRRAVPADAGCFECGSTEHRIGNCPVAREVIARGGKLKIGCKGCGERTHLTANCPAGAAGKK